MYEEHYEEKEYRDDRVSLLRYECYRHDGAMWKLYIGEECFESAYARQNAPEMDGERPEVRQERIERLAINAGAKTKSVLTQPPIDDRD